MLPAFLRLHRPRPRRSRVHPFLLGPIIALTLSLCPPAEAQSATRDHLGVTETGRPSASAASITHAEGSLIQFLPAFGSRHQRTAAPTTAAVFGFRVAQASRTLQATDPSVPALPPSPPEPTPSPSPNETADPEPTAIPPADESGDPEPSAIPPADESGNPLQPNLEPPLPSQQIEATQTEPAVDLSDEPEVELDGLTQRNTAFKIVYGIQSRLEFDDNIFISPKNEQADLIFTLSPTIAFGWGEVHSEVRRQQFGALPEGRFDEAARSFIYLSYTPTVSLFAEHDSENSLDHDLLLEAQAKFAYLTLGSKTVYKTMTIAEVDVGTRMRVTTYSETISAGYDYSDRTSFAAKLSATVRENEIGRNHTIYITEGSVNYKYSERTSFSLGAKFGLLKVQDSPDQIFEQGLVGANYLVTSKISVSGYAGVEFRQVQEGGVNSTNPVFDVNLNYQPFDQTTISLNATRYITNSARSQNQNIDYTGISASIQQRLFQRYHAGFSVEYINANYTQAEAGISVSREDNILLLRPSIRMDLTKTASLLLGYSYRQNDSTLGTRSFVDNKVFLQLELLF